MLSAALVSFGVIFVAELGDKSQLMALAFAARYRALPVLVGITLATAVVHLFSVVVGVTLGASPPTHLITAVAGLAFLGFAVWTLRGDSLSEGDAARGRFHTGSAVVAASVAFFVAELGDKTMLATLTLATTEDGLGTWVGSTAGTVAANALAIALGGYLGARLPERAIRYGAATLFAIFGLLLLLGATRVV